MKRKKSDFWKIFGFGGNFGFGKTFCILEEVSSFQNIWFFGEKKSDFAKFSDFFPEMSYISELIETIQIFTCFVGGIF